MNKDLIFLYNLVNANLYAQAPVMSGNLKNHIKVVSVSENKVVIRLEARFYDTKHWEKTGQIKYTKGWKKDPSITNYAMFLNEVGAFGTRNKSMHWVNRTLYQVCKAYADKNGWEVNNTLPLD